MKTELFSACKLVIVTTVIFVLNTNILNAAIEYKEIDSAYAHKAIYVHDKFLPIVNVDIAFKHAGFSADPKDKLGLTRIYSDLADSFNFAENFVELKNLVERKAINISFSADRRNFYISLKFIRGDYKYVAKLLNKFFVSKSFQSNFLNLAKEELVTIRKQKYKNSNYLSSLNFQREMFAESKYAESSYGSEESILNIGLEDIINYQRNRFARDNLYVSIAGNLDNAEIEHFLRASFINLSKKSDLKHYTPTISQKKFIEVAYPEKKQVIIKSGTRGLSEKSKDYHAFYLFNHIMGGSGFTSRLGKILREEKGLTYGAGSYIVNVADQALWVLSFSTDKAKYSNALFEIKRIINELSHNPITQVELDAAKEKVTAGFSIYYSSNSRISGSLLTAIIDGIDPSVINTQIDKVNQVSLEQINKVVEDLVPSFEDFVTVIVGDIN